MEGIAWETISKKTDIELANDIISEKNLGINEIESERIEAKQLRKKKYETLLKLIIGMAVGGYSYDQNASCSPISREVSDVYFDPVEPTILSKNSI